jgi:hypothetical protein
MITRNELVTAYKRARGKRRCIASRLMNGKCSSKYGRAHSLSIERVLRPIAREGKVYRLSSDLGVLLQSDGLVDVRLDGIRRASTFYGFCEVRDAELFRPIEIEYSSVDQRTATLHLYRALCHELVKKQAALDVAAFIIGRLGQSSLLRIYRAGLACAVLSLFEHLERIEGAFLTERYEEIHFEAFYSCAKANLVCGSVWFPDRDLSGATLQILPQREHVPALLGLFALPHRSGSVVILAWHDVKTWCVQRLLHSIVVSTKKKK